MKKKKEPLKHDIDWHAVCQQALYVKRYHLAQMMKNKAAWMKVDTNTYNLIPTNSLFLCKICNLNITKIGPNPTVFKNSDH